MNFNFSQSSPRVKLHIAQPILYMKLYDLTHDETRRLAASQDRQKIELISVTLEGVYTRTLRFRMT